jgi:hypothetical protein
MTQKIPYRSLHLKRDHARPRSKPAISDAAVEARLTELVSSSTYALTHEYHVRGLRSRVLNLPIMVAFLLALVWRQIPSVGELLRLLAREPLLWVPPLQVTQQAVALRLRTLPADLFGEVFAAILPRLHQRSAARSRPVSPVIVRALSHFARIQIVDATTLEELFAKVGLLRGTPTPPLGGKLLGLLDLPSKLPVQVWLDADPAVNDKSFLDQVEAVLLPGTMLLFDAGFYSFAFFDWLSAHQVSFLTRARVGSVPQITPWLTNTDQLRDCVVQYGKYRAYPSAGPLRLIEVGVNGTWHRYLTNVLDPTILSTDDVVALYGQRWRIEEAFLVTKRLLGLSYLWTGAFNGIALQVWVSWLLYAVLVDLSDAIAQELDLPLDRISLEMVYRGLYHFTRAHDRGETTDPIAYLAAQTDLGIVKRKRKTHVNSLDKPPPMLNL